MSKVYEVWDNKLPFKKNMLKWFISLSSSAVVTYLVWMLLGFGLVRTLVSIGIGIAWFSTAFLVIEESMVPKEIENEKHRTKTE